MPDVLAAICREGETAMTKAAANISSLGTIRKFLAEGT